MDNQRSNSYKSRRDNYKESLAAFGVSETSEMTFSQARKRRKTLKAENSQALAESQLMLPVSQFTFQHLTDMNDSQMWDYPLTPSPKVGDPISSDSDEEKENTTNETATRQQTDGSETDWSEGDVTESRGPEENFLQRMSTMCETNGGSGTTRIATKDTLRVTSELLIRVAKLKAEENLGNQAVMGIFKIIRDIVSGKIHTSVEEIPRTPKAFERKIGVFKYDRTFHWRCSHIDCNTWQTAPVQRTYKKRKCDSGHQWKRGNEIIIQIHIAELLRDMLPKLNYYVAEEDDNAAVRRLKRTVGFQKDDVMLVLNTDGFPLTSTSSSSAWPVLAWVHGTSHRTKKSLNMFLLALWKGEAASSKPHFNDLLSPVLRDIQATENNPILWTDSKGVTRSTRVFVLSVLVDSVARNPLMGVRGFQARFGCPYCYHDQCGPYYRYDQEPANRREHEDYIKGFEYTLNGSSTIVKEEQSVMLQLPYFSMTIGFPVDPMHCIYEGVFKLMTNAFLSSKYHKSEFYIKPKQQKELDLLLVAQQPPDRVRAPRSLTTRKNYRAHEWELWGLYYAPVLLSSFLPSVYFKHFMLLVEAVSTLMVPCSFADLDSAESNLKAFCKGIQDLYPQEFCRFNVHLLLHLPEFVVHYGPLSGFTMSPFENANYVLKNFVTGAQFKAQQICTRFLEQFSSFVNTEEASEESKVKKQAFRIPVQDDRLLPLEHQKQGIKVFGKYTGGSGTTLKGHVGNQALRHNNCCYFLDQFQVIEIDYFAEMPSNQEVYISATLYKVKHALYYISHIFEVLSSKKVFIPLPKYLQVAIKIKKDGGIYMLNFLNDIELNAE